MNKVEIIMEDMLKKAKEIDQEGLCLGLFNIQEILNKHLQDTTEERGKRNKKMFTMLNTLLGMNS